MNTRSEERFRLRYVQTIFWNNNERRLRAFWRLLGTVFFILILTAISASVLSEFVVIPAPAAPYIGQLHSNVFVVVGILLAIRFLDKRKFSESGMQLNANWWIDLGFGLVLGVLLTGVIFIVELAAGWLTVSETFRTASPGQPFLVAVLLPAFFYVSVGIAEEMAFRGYLLRNLAEGFNLWFISPIGALIISWLVTSSIFGVAHAIRPDATIVSCAMITLSGIWAGLAYVLTGRLAIPIGVHITWNFFLGNVFGFPVSGTNFFPTTFVAIEQDGHEAWTGGDFGPEGGFVGLLAIVLGIFFVTIWVRMRYGELTFSRAIAKPLKRQIAGG